MLHRRFAVLLVVSFQAIADVYSNYYNRGQLDISELPAVVVLVGTKWKPSQNMTKPSLAHINVA